MIDSHEIEFRVRYSEADPMGYLHHSRFFGLFETGRMELFRAQGGDYRQMEARGFLMVVVHVECDYKRPARFDDLLRLRTRVVRTTPAKLEHGYELFREGELLARGRSVLACVDRSGEVQRITPEVLFGDVRV